MYLRERVLILLLLITHTGGRVDPKNEERENGVWGL